MAHEAAPVRLRLGIATRRLEGTSVERRTASDATRHVLAPGGEGAAASTLPSVDAVLPAPGEVGPLDDEVRFVELPPPSQAEVKRLLESRGALPAQGPEDARQAYQAQSLQQRFRWTGVGVRPPNDREGRSGHAGRHHAPSLT